MNVSIQHGPSAPAGDMYWRRRDEVAAMAAGIGQPPVDVEYTDVENEVWAQVAAALDPAWDRHAAAVLLTNRSSLDLNRNQVPQLRVVSEKLQPLSGFRFDAVPGLVDKATFFGALADERFLSTQYVRWHGSPLYTPEPDVIHEVFGHGHLLACPRLAELHRLAGRAMSRVESAAARQVIADVFWFSGEFGVVNEHGEWKAYGAGLLSSIGEIEWFETNALIQPLDVSVMATTPYDISEYQPVLFGADSIDEVLEVVGGFYSACTDESIAALLEARPHGGDT